MKVFMIFNTYIATIFSKNAAICSDTSGSITIQSAGPDHESLNFKAMSHNGLAVLTSLGNLWEMQVFRPATHQLNQKLWRRGPTVCLNKPSDNCEAHTQVWEPLVQKQWLNVRTTWWAFKTWGLGQSQKFWFNCLEWLGQRHQYFLKVPLKWSNVKPGPRTTSLRQCWLISNSWICSIAITRELLDGPNLTSHPRIPGMGSQSPCLTSHWEDADRSWSLRTTCLMVCLLRTVPSVCGAPMPMYYM